MAGAQPEAAAEEAIGGATASLSPTGAPTAGPGSAGEEEGVIFILEKACLEVGNVGKVTARPRILL